MRSPSLLLAALLSAATALHAQTAVAPARAHGPTPTLVLTVVDSTADAEPHHGHSRKAKPGDVLHYHLVFQNVLNGPVRNVILNGPIPSGTAYIPGSAGSATMWGDRTYSVDHGRSFAMMPVDTTIGPDGKPAEHVVPAERYTAIRWTIPGPVPAKATVAADYDVRILTKP
jgi:uncharacterized repeat protein (TIGR01451 family)